MVSLPGHACGERKKEKRPQNMLVLRHSCDAASEVTWNNLNDSLNILHKYVNRLLSGFGSVDNYIGCIQFR